MKYRTIGWLVALAAVAAAVALVSSYRHGHFAPLPAKSTGWQGQAALSDEWIATELAAPDYMAAFDRRYARIVGARRHGLYESSNCQVSAEGWRYRPRDAFRPFSSDVDWADPGDKDSNWAWRHHSLHLIDCYMVGYLQDGKPSHLREIHLLLQDWMQDNASGPKAASRFAWGDHTTALRLRGVIQLYAELTHREVLDTAFAIDLTRFVYLHTDRLLRDQAIIRSKHNHALDQVNALAMSNQFFPFLDYDQIHLRDEVVRRFEVERDHLIAGDGVATENSPGYHMWVPTRIAIMEETLELLGEDSRAKALRRRNGSLEFATWIQAPDGYLPQIGDTPPGKRANIRLPGQHALPAFDQYVYAMSEGDRGSKPGRYFKVFPDAGYFIFRSDWQKPLQDDTHLALKCGFLADAHRHADDGSFTLSAGGEHWFVDTGMYGYEAGPLRAHAISASAHNISLLPGDTVLSIESRRYERHMSRWGLSGFRQTAPRAAEVTCTSFMFPDAIYRRDLDIDGKKITLSDSFGFDRPGPVPVTRFQVPHDKSIELRGRDGARICSTAGTCIDLDFQGDRIQAVSVVDGADAKADAFQTRAYLKTEPSQVIEVRWRAGVEGNEFTIRL